MVLAVSGLGLQSNNSFLVQVWSFQLKVHIRDSHAHKGHIDFQILSALRLLNNIPQVMSYTQCLVAEVS